MPYSAQLDEKQTAPRAPFFRRIWIALVILIALLLMVFLPPYINVNRYQRRITQSISASLGRPVHLDHVTLNLLPIPGFTLERFVVSEDPAFGYEPTIRADTVHATLRVSSLWRRHVEFSTISLTDPSINLVHTSNGKWNLDSILLQASHIDTAPTAQRTAGPAPRFPYIEATGARLNLKLDNVKTPFSLTDADFSLYLPSPQTWNVRITAHPARTDLPVGYTGILHLDGTLGRAPTLDQIPIDLHAEWKSAPLGEISRIVLGRDAGLRGDMTLTASALGTVGSNELHTRLRIDDIHRPDFVPANALSVTTECTATVTSAFHSITSAHCAIPANSSSAPPLLSFSGSLDDIRHPGPTSVSAELPPTPAANLVGLLQTLSTRTPERLTLGGVLSGTVSYNVLATSATELKSNILLKGGTLAATPDAKSSIAMGDAILTTETGSHPAALTPSRRRSSNQPERATQSGEEGTFTLQPTTLALGAREPAILNGTITPEGYTLHLAGSATPERLAALSVAVPQLANGLPKPLAKTAAASATPTAPIHLDLTTTSLWGHQPIWEETAPAPQTPSTHRRRAR
ncbi:AsmA family protein [Granulicella sibirica]|uniref:AsmA domain-containing protein n=1 Tax=Granulicella sibirica TaxID=2479048 RepID=A0A4Q0SYY4_9BACT|nr:AsmA family protein [Granulicella sibirica]RXH54421.1 hypothetical protein GRAN_4717 [Granulicella sibirica]